MSHDRQCNSSSRASALVTTLTIFLAGCSLLLPPKAVEQSGDLGTPPPPASKPRNDASYQQRMAMLKEAVDRLIPLTARIEAVRPDWERRLAVNERDDLAKVEQDAPVLRYRTRMQSATMGAAAAPRELCTAYATLAIRGAYAHLSTANLQPDEKTPSMWTDMLTAGAALCSDTDRSFARRAYRLLEETAKVLDYGGISLQAYIVLAADAELHGERSRALEYRGAALDVAERMLANEHEAKVELLMYSDGSTREEAEQIVPTMALNLLSDLYSSTAAAIAASHEPELEPRIRSILERAATQTTFTGHTGIQLAIAAHASGHQELAVKLLPLAATSLDMPGYDPAVVASVKAEMMNTPGHKEGFDAEELRTKLVKNIVAQSGRISTQAWRDLAATARAIDERASAAQLAVNDAANKTLLKEQSRVRRAAALARATKIARAYPSSVRPEEIVDLSALLDVSLPVDLSYLLDRIEEPALAIALLAFEVTRLEATRATVDVAERRAFFGSLRSQRAYAGLMRLLVERAGPLDKERAVALGELARARQFKDLTGKGHESNESLVSAPEAFAKRVMTGLRDDQLVLVYHIFDDGLLTVAIERRTVTTSFVKRDRHALETLVAATHDALATPGSDATPRLAELSAELISPVAAQLRGKHEILIVPDGALNTIPFETLSQPDNKRLLETHQSIRYLPSLAFMAAIRSSTRGSSVFGMADPTYPALAEGTLPPLPETRVEVQAIASHFAKAKTLQGADASESALKQADLTGYDFVHFATHGLLGHELPNVLEPSLVFSAGAEDDGFLTSSEAQQLKLRAKVAVLSACNTGSGQIFAGEGAMGMSRAFLVAGAEAVVVSLWEVPSEATTTLMVSFYEHMARGLAPAVALREAKLSLVTGAGSSQAGTSRGLVLSRDKVSGATSHPHYWSAFVVIGG